MNTHHHDEIDSGKFFFVRSCRFLPLKDKAPVLSVGECSILKMGNLPLLSMFSVSVGTFFCERWLGPVFHHLNWIL